MIFENIRYMNILQKLSLGVMAFPVMQIAAQQARPNIILIVTDQQSYNTIGAHSDMYRGSYFSTPNIDRLVMSGISFTRTYCANPVSVPSRFSLFTSNNGAQYNIRDNRCTPAEEEKVHARWPTHGAPFPPHRRRAFQRGEGTFAFFRKDR